MAKYSGNIGFSVTEELAPGIWRPAQLVERRYVGDVLRNAYRYSQGFNPDFNVSIQISVIADSFMLENLSTMKYVSYLGTNWEVSTFEMRYPRIIITLGGVYNGPNGNAPTSS